MEEITTRNLTPAHAAYEDSAKQSGCGPDSMQVAVFIDYENVYWGLVNQYNFKPQVPHLISLIIKEVEKDGNLLIKKVYADWERREFDGAQASFKRVGVEPTFALSKKTVKGTVSVWKESADAILILDAQQTLYERSEIDEFVLVTGDRGCLDLIHRLKSRGKVVKICALESAIATELSNAVGAENVVSIEALLGIEPAVRPKAGEDFIVNGNIDWKTVIQSFNRLQSRLPFVALKLARDRFGFTQEIIDEGKQQGVFQVHSVANPGQPYPTTGLRLDANNEIVMEALKK